MVKELGIKAEEFAKRRHRLAEKMPVSSIAILPGGIKKFRNNDAEYLFRQESHFYYLTGFSEEEALLTLIKKEDGQVEFILFCQAHDPQSERWEGKRVGQEGALKQFGAHRAYPIEEIDRIMPELLMNNKQIFYSRKGRKKDNDWKAWDERIEGWHKLANKLAKDKVKKDVEILAAETLVDLFPIINEARLIKSPAEIALMREAARISAEAHIQLMEKCRPDQMEYELEALFTYECLRKGCRALAYSPIVGGGINACTLHYVQNGKPLKSGELVLIDAGAEYKYYAADITRTIPINGKFTIDQKALYECVLKAQESAIEAIKPGVHWDKLQEIIVRVLVEGLVELGILSGDLKTLIQQKAYHKFYMHSSGHWLGLDVHDVGDYKINGKYRVLEPGMVLTVEPGIYLSPEMSEIDKRWRGMGIRIEDDVLVTETGYEVLTEKVPKTVLAIEQLMNAKK